MEALQNLSCREASQPPRELPGMCLVLVPDEAKRIRLQHIQIIHDFISRISQHLNRQILGEVVEMPEGRSTLDQIAPQDRARRDIQRDVNDFVTTHRPDGPEKAEIVLEMLQDIQ